MACCAKVDPGYISMILYRGPSHRLPPMPGATGTLCWPKLEAVIEKRQVP